jgi:hypothetical protein
MSEWWSYTLSDFLLFAPRTYYRLFELHNSDIWPMQVVSLLLGVAILVLARGDGAWRGRAVAAILAACWLWVGWAFHIQRYATINWVAPWFGAAFVIEASLLLGIGVLHDGFLFRPAGDPVRRAGLCVLLFALVVQPLIGPLVGRDWRQAEIFGVAPDPTVVATIGVLLLVASRGVWPLLVIPLLWCVVGGAFLWAMDAPDAIVMPLVTLMALLIVVRKSEPVPPARRRT